LATRRALSGARRSRRVAAPGTAAAPDAGRPGRRTRQARSCGLYL